MLRQDFPPPLSLRCSLDAPALLRRFGSTALIKHDSLDKEIKSRSQVTRCDRCVFRSPSRSIQNVAPSERDRAGLTRKRHGVRQGARARRAGTAERDPIRLFIGYSALTKIETNCRLSSEFTYILALVARHRPDFLFRSPAPPSRTRSLYE